ncbi:hypothetical protein [Sphingomonas changbaiensis]|uniref:hypothetical protein n=1 Tax=Sphingomonas changbaiensis TaxID=529705 RepID=UPI00146FE384|nr:hypothetical protein [Sphingomonas changbaiensis]
MAILCANEDRIARQPVWRGLAENCFHASIPRKNEGAAVAFSAAAAGKVLDVQVRVRGVIAPSIVPKRCYPGAVADPGVELQIIPY